MTFLTISITIKIEKGKARLAFPEALGREPLKSSLSCNSLCFGANPEAKSEARFLICSGSHFCGEDRHMKNNILAMFQNTPLPNIVHFPELEVPVTSPQEKWLLKIVDYEGNICENVSCVGVVVIKGFVANRMLAI